nr:hypothetical protein [Deefgea rivuli]
MNYELHIPVMDKTTRKDGALSRDDFEWDEAAGEYRCPAGNQLRIQWRDYKMPRSRVTSAGSIIYRSRTTDCATCSMKEKRGPNTIVV